MHFFAQVLPRSRRFSQSHCGVQIVIHPHEVVGRWRGVTRPTSSSSGSKAVLVLAVLGCATLACLAGAGGASAANTSGGTLAETVQSVSARHAPVVPQASRAHFSSKANAASSRMHATQQHLALVKQVLACARAHHSVNVVHPDCAPLFGPCLLCVRRYTFVRLPLSSLTVGWCRCCRMTRRPRMRHRPRTWQPLLLSRRLRARLRVRLGI